MDDRHFALRHRFWSWLSYRAEDFSQWCDRRIVRMETGLPARMLKEPAREGRVTRRDARRAVLNVRSKGSA